MQTRMESVLSVLLATVLAAGNLAPLAAQARGQSRGAAAPAEDLDTSRSEMRALIERYIQDRGSLLRVYPLRLSPARAERIKRFHTEWRDKLATLDFAGMSRDGRVDYVLFKNHLDHELLQLDIEAKRREEMAPLVPFSAAIIELEETRRAMQPVNARRAADVLNKLKAQIGETQKRVEAGLPATGRGARGGGESAAQEQKIEPIKVKKAVANRGLGAVGSLRGTLRSWFNFYNEYDPIFTWWCEAPYKEADEALNAYSKFLAERVLGLRLRQDARGTQAEGGPGGQRRPAADRPAVAVQAGDTSDIIGDPIGHDALMAELAHEMIPYTPEELIAIARKELAWCEEEMKKASRDLGYGDDWHKALEHVKNLHVEPGKQPDLIRDLALEAVKYVEENDLLTVPPLAKEDWRIEMMSAERQLVSPFFLGGDNIIVSYPTASMSHEQKLMSMRGNNPHFSRATVHHELIPGHHLQGFMTARYKPYRNVFSTPFWGEGWALYWELLLWDRGFAKTPENRIGMLFWRMHRCARIVFSLSFHLEKMTPQECIELLVERVGHERENATAEVRRSLDGSYGPLYQAAYLLGGLQIYSLQKELVGSGKMTNKQFHDAILREGRIPVEMVRAILTQQPPPRDFKSSWKFYGPAPQN